MLCVWIFYGQPQLNILFNITDFFTEEDYDFLEIAAENDPIQHFTISGNKYPMYFTISDDQAQVPFYSEWSK